MSEIQLKFTAKTANPEQTTYGISVNKPLNSDWAKAGTAKYSGKLISYIKGDSLTVPISDNIADIKFIDTGVDAPPVDKWEISLIVRQQTVASSLPLDKYATNLFDFGKITIPPPPPTTPPLIPQPRPQPPTTTTPTPVTSVPITEVTTVKVDKPALPFGFGWLKPVLDFLDAWFSDFKKLSDQRHKDIQMVTEQLNKDTEDARKSVTDTLAPLTKLVTDPVGFFQGLILGALNGIASNKDKIISEAETEIVLKSIHEEQFTTPEMKKAVTKLRANMTGTPDNISQFINAIFIEPAAALKRALDEFLIPEPPVDFEKANKTKEKLFALALDFWILSTILDVVSTAVSATLIRNLALHTRSFITIFNFEEFIKIATEPALSISINEPLTRGLNNKFRNNRMGVSDAIEAVVKEKVTVQDFIKRMNDLGYTDTEAQIIYDKHFAAPARQEVLTAWRRGIINDEELAKLFIIIDLDPKFNNIWDTIKYVDPSMSEARFMFETGAIDETRVKDILRRSGLTPEYVDNLTDFITRFQERLWRRRYLVSLAGGYERGAITADRLRTEVLAASYTEGVADWIIKTADIRKEIRRNTVKATKSRALTRAQVLSSLSRNQIPQDNARERLLDEGYDEQDVNIMMQEALLEVENFTEEGYKIRTLTTPQIMKALKDRLITESDARERFAGKHYTDIDIDILIELSKAPKETP